MIVTSKIVSGLALATIIALAASPPANAGSCGRYGGWGIGVTKDIAMFMSNKALHNMIEKNGEKGVGKVTTTCKEGPVVDCVSKQKSCK